MRGRSVFHPEVNIPVMRQLLEEKMLLPGCGFSCNPVCCHGAKTLQFTKDNSAYSHDLGTFTVPISSLKVHCGEGGRVELCPSPPCLSEAGMC